MKIECPKCGHGWEPVEPNVSAAIPDMVSTTTVAKKFGLKPRTVRRWIDSGRLPAVRRWVNSRARWMVRPEDVRRLMEPAVVEEGSS